MRLFYFRMMLLVAQPSANCCFRKHVLAKTASAGMYLCFRAKNCFRGSAATVRSILGGCCSCNGRFINLPRSFRRQTLPRGFRDCSPCPPVHPLTWCACTGDKNEAQWRFWSILIWLKGRSPQRHGRCAQGPRKKRSLKLANAWAQRWISVFWPETQIGAKLTPKKVEGNYCLQHGCPEGR